MVDASVWVAWFQRQDPHHRQANGWLLSVISSGSDIFVPAIVLAEVAGPISRQTGNPELGTTAASRLLEIPMVHIVEINRLMADISALLAARLRLRGADSVYVATAALTGSELITLDNEQRERASVIVAASTPFQTGPRTT